MSLSLGERHLSHASRTRQSRTHSVEIQEGSIARVWDGETYSRPEHLDEYSAISGDDLARIAYFEPADPNIKPIGEQRGIWSQAGGRLTGPRASEGSDLPRVDTGKSPVRGKSL